MVSAGDAVDFLRRHFLHKHAMAFYDSHKFTGKVSFQVAVDHHFINLFSGFNGFYNRADSKYVVVFFEHFCCSCLVIKRSFDIILFSAKKGRLPFIVLLDGVTDVRNFGAIARTCECAGVDAIVIPRRGGVGVNGDAMKTSAGALNYLPVCRETSILNAVKFLKDNGYMVVAASEKSTLNYTLAEYTSSPVALVMGAEDVGISEDVLRFCDTKVAIPQIGHIGSLNVSVAAGVMIYEVVRQRLAANEVPE